MSLTKEKILANANKYFQTWENYGFANNELIEFLGNEFVGAPASTSTNLHNAFEGGLIDHTLRVTKYAVSINNALPEDLRANLNSLIKVCCLHQIGKAKLFKPNSSEWHVKNQGKIYEFNDELVSMSIGERSVYYATNYGMKFTEDEYQAVLNFTKDDTDKQAKYHSNVLAVILKQAIELAVVEEQAKNG